MIAKFHSLGWQDVVNLFQSNIATGLDAKEARRRLSRWGLNRIVEKKKIGWIKLLLSQFVDPMVITLLGATLISAAMGEIVDALVIAAIVFLNAFMGVIQEYKAEESLESLRTFSSSVCCVIRNSIEIEVFSEDIVPGDIVLLWPGERVPADGRLIDSQSLQLEESILTGEAYPVSKSSDIVVEATSPISERKNMVYSGTLVTRGSGALVVTSTGMNTEIGQIAGLLQVAKSQKTPLESKLDSLSKILLATCLSVCIALALIGFFRGIPFHQMFLTAVSLAVAAIPEGLPATVTLCLAVGVQTMAKKGAVVRKLEAIETLGSVTVICTDKTGTLTKNQMEIVEIGIPDLCGIKTVSGNFKTQRNKTLTKQIIEVGVLASDARHVSEDGFPGREDPTEQSIISRYIDLGYDPKFLDTRFQRVEEKSFTPERRMMSVKVDTPEGFLICVKGATDTVMPLCTAQEIDKQLSVLSGKEIAIWEDWINERALRGMRILAVAKKLLRKGKNLSSYNESNLVFLGCLAMADPLRDEAADSVEKCKIAGIRPILITGDHLKTAESIARDAHILARSEEGMIGETLDMIPKISLGDAVENCNVFARVSPAHKLKIVQALKKQGHIVAMTGDGINDGPALKEAAVGVAMGKSGTDIARQASSMILIDDNFATIVKAVEQGRAIYDNIRKFIRYMLSCNLGEVIIMTLALVLGLPVPLTPIQILWMNLVTDGLPALALSMDPPDSAIMLRPPRDPNEGLFAHGLYGLILKRGIYVGVASLLMFIEAMRIWDLPTASTMAFATLITVQLVSAIDCRSETQTPLEVGIFSNPYLVGACLLSWLMLFATVQMPNMCLFFDTVPLDGIQWAIVFLVSVMPDVFRIAYQSKNK